MSSDALEVFKTKGLDPYEVLNIENTDTVTDSLVKKSYRSLALKYHPDKNPDDSAREQFELISLAYDILTDPETRKQVDESRKARIIQIERDKALDSKRRQMKRDLEQREASSKRRKAETISVSEIARLQKESAEFLQARNRPRSIDLEAGATVKCQVPLSASSEALELAFSKISKVESIQIIKMPKKSYKIAMMTFFSKHDAEKVVSFDYSKAIGILKDIKHCKIIGSTPLQKE
ncbi:hypothetical protein CANCADRAFT_83975 [Tortispora caseinolytica NRRL Y-17796]|uniref:J domain-containing protein n=1 Tax=Tortispora caseinolytica NRRL Y-17796 TaxID=767744 RepID=A0A1E4TKB4_9ASCO|nr:hypothetical protein CANCADRAFT_83975 [Tortispora caseinolytica NRRL Y-17796]